MSTGGDTGEPLDLLLARGEVAALELDETLQIRRVHNRRLLQNWLPIDSISTDALPDLSGCLAGLFGPRQAQQVREGLEQQRMAPRRGGLDLGVLPGRPPRSAAIAPHFDVRIHALGAAQEPGVLLLLRDQSQQHALAQSLEELRTTSETALAVLRAPPEALRLFLGSAMASVAAIRATLRMPARTLESLRAKLERLRAEVVSLGGEAREIGLSPVTEACQALADATAVLQQRETISGDDLLPLAPRIDTVASAIGSTSRIEEQRYEQPPAASEPARRARRSAAWPEVSERRWSEFLRRRGEEIGVLAKLAMSGADQVPVSQQRHIDEILQQLLKNALEHGIETPEDRLAAGKSAAGKITVSFTHDRNGGLKLTVHDDGRGFDLTRIGRAAVQSGLVREESLANREAGDLVGLIFKPAFTTEGLQEGEGQGRGMPYLRRKITRLGGQIAVATKPGRYTLFTIELPDSHSAAEPAGVPQAMP